MGGFDATGIIVYLAGVNAAAFAAFGVDKARARRGAWRISESALLLLAIVGGSAGAFAGMRLFHHKTRKSLFAIGVPAVLVAHIALAAWLLAPVIHFPVGK